MLSSMERLGRDSINIEGTAALTLIEMLGTQRVILANNQNGCPRMIKKDNGRKKERNCQKICVFELNNISYTVK
jgi:hypothetical protein